MAQTGAVMSTAYGVALYIDPKSPPRDAPAIPATNSVATDDAQPRPLEVGDEVEDVLELLDADVESCCRRARRNVVG